jgi:hypothetical protein
MTTPLRIAVSPQWVCQDDSTCPQRRQLSPKAALTARRLGSNFAAGFIRPKSLLAFKSAIRP